MSARLLVHSRSLFVERPVRRDACRVVTRRISEPKFESHTRTFRAWVSWPISKVKNHSPIAVIGSPLPTNRIRFSPPEWQLGCSGVKATVAPVPVATAWGWNAGRLPDVPTTAVARLRAGPVPLRTGWPAPCNPAPGPGPGPPARRTGLAAGPRRAAVGRAHPACRDRPAER